MFLRNKISYFAIGAIAIVFLAGILSFDYEKNNTPDARAAATENVRGFAWSENIGWISFNSLNCDTDDDGLSEGVAADGGTDGCPVLDSIISPYGVNLNADNTLSGYAWSSNIGWISFQAADVAVCPSGTCQPRLVGSDFYGWARALVNGGGWSGWISLNSENCDIFGGVSNGFIDVACGGDNATTSVTNYNTKLNGVDFEGFAWSDMVMGWISFNSTNCDTNNNTFIDLGVCGGADNNTTPVKNYKVYLSAPLNNPPTADSLQVNSPAGFCLIPPLFAPPSYTFSWNFSDPDGDNQSQFRIQIDNDPNFLSAEVDRTFPGGANSQQVLIVDGVVADRLSYSQTYYWRVMVWDDNATLAGSVWIYPPASTVNPGTPFTTEAHLWPTVDFSPPSPSSFIVNIPIQFCSNSAGSCVANTNKSVCYDNSNNPVNCASWIWNFGDQAINPFDPIEDIKENPIHTYTIANPVYDVILTVTDANGNICSNPAGSKILGATRPKWKEVSPK